MIGVLLLFGGALLLIVSLRAVVRDRPAESAATPWRNRPRGAARISRLR